MNQGGAPRPGLSSGDRLRAWLVTGPLARLAAFLIELGAALLGAARRRVRAIRER